jgi:hypothetical protein
LMTFVRSLLYLLSHKSLILKIFSVPRHHILVVLCSGPHYRCFLADFFQTKFINSFPFPFLSLASLFLWTFRVKIRVFFDSTLFIL